MQLARLTKTGTRTLDITPAELAQGLLIVGQQGMGQTQLLKSLLAQQLRAEHPVGLIDTGGAFLPELAGFAPTSSINDAALLDFADTDWPVAFNPVAGVPAADRVAAKDALMTALQALSGDSWGPRLEYILANACMAAIEARGGTLLTLHELLSDSDVRARVLAEVTDPFVCRFFAAEFDQWDERFRRDAISPIQNKVGQFLLDPTLRNVVCQTKTAVPALGTASALLARAPHARIGETASRLLGMTLLARWLRTDAAATVHVPDLHRLDAPGLPALIERATETDLRLVVSVPSLATLSDELREAVLAHMGHLVAVRLGADDAELLRKQLDRFNPDRAAQEAMSLQPGELMVRRRQQAVAQQYEKGLVPELPAGWRLSVMEKVIEQSRERYAVPRSTIEAKLSRHMSRTGGQASA